MKERPINMRAEEVRAILAGRKTQFRRVMRTQPSEGLSWRGVISHSTVRADEGKHLFTDCYPRARQAQRIGCPDGKPGDRLWVRETTWWRFDGLDGNVMTGYVADGEPVRSGQHRETMIEQGPHYKVPSIHMPRKLSRITLEIVSVRVERLQDLSEEDAIAEGYNSQSIMENPDAGRLWFRGNWQSINGPEDWSENPWVWAVEFRRLEGTQ